MSTQSAMSNFGSGMLFDKVNGYFPPVSAGKTSTSVYQSMASLFSPQTVEKPLSTVPSLITANWKIIVAIVIAIIVIVLIGLALAD